MQATKTHLEFRWTTSRGRDTYGYNVCTLFADGRKVARCNGGGYDMEGTCLGTFLESHYADRLRALKPEDMPENSHWQSSYKYICGAKCHEEYVTALMAAVESKSTEPETPSYDRDTQTCPVCGSEDLRAVDLGQRIEDGRYFYGLTFHDPHYDPAQAVIGRDCSDRTLSNEPQDGVTVGEAEAQGVSFGLERLQAAYSASSTHATERHTVPSIDGACGKSSVEKIAEAIGLTFEYVPSRSKKQTIYIVHDSRGA